MRIGIDSRVLEKKMTGVGRYLYNILGELPQYDQVNKYILLSRSKIKIENSFYEKVSFGKDKLPEKISSSIWLNYLLPYQLKKEEIDLFFTPNHLLPFKKLNNIKTVIVVHDVFHKINNTYHPLSYSLYLDLLLPGSLKKSDVIITVSNCSKKDIIKVFNIPEQKIHVIHEYADDSFKPMLINDNIRDSIIRKYKLPTGKFLLYVGLLENRKNITGILKTADILNKKGIKINILLVGRKGYGFEKIYEEIEKRNNFVRYLNYVEEETLKIIYNMATLFFFPSYYEGFGLPPLEAMQTGIPVLASNTSSLVEVVGDGGVLHDPDNHEAFAMDIEKLLSDQEFYREMKQKALMQANKFGKEESIKKLLEVFSKLN